MEKSGGQDCLSLPKQLKAPYLKCCRHTFLVLPEPSWLCQQVGNFFFLSMNIVSKRRQPRGAGIRTRLPRSRHQVPLFAQIDTATTAPLLGEIAELPKLLPAGSYAGSTGLAWHSVVHLPNLRVLNLRLCNTTELRLWETLFIWLHLVCQHHFDLYLF